MHHVIKYVLDTKNLGLKIEPNLDKDEPWNLVSFCNSYYACNPDIRPSVSGYIFFVCRVPIFWWSKAQCRNTLSSTESGY